MRGKSIPGSNEAFLLQKVYKSLRSHRKDSAEIVIILCRSLRVRCLPELELPWCLMTREAPYMPASYVQGCLLLALQDEGVDLCPPAPCIVHRSTGLEPRLPLRNRQEFRFKLVPLRGVPKTPFHFRQ